VRELKDQGMRPTEIAKALKTAEPRFIVCWGRRPIPGQRFETCSHWCRHRNQNHRFLRVERPRRIDEAGGRFSASPIRSSARAATRSFRSAISSSALFDLGSPMSSAQARASSPRNRQC
jgi:hypothetical protein